MSHDHPHGKPEIILKFTNNNEVIIIDEPLKKMFEHSDVKDRKIVAFSIIGAFRKGKSFFLDYCLRFLYAHYKSINYPSNPLSAPHDWMGDEDAPLQGFSWRSGSIRDTTGIVMWNDIFLHTIESSGEKIAIVVMDTQGLFDHKTVPINNSRIFALGTLISSIQVLNLVDVVQEDQLQYLQFATEYAKFTAIDSQGMAGKPFQNLLFLIRDWKNPDEHSFGFEGGKSYLNSVLKIESNQIGELKSVRQFIRDSFDELSCALLPHPGFAVVGGKKNQTKPYDGNWGQMDEDFKEELELVIKHLLSPERLVMKKISGKELKGSEFEEYLLHYFNLFQSDTIPQTQSIYESTVEKQLNILSNQCVEKYKEILYKNEDLIVSSNYIQLIYNMSRLEALNMFNNARKMGNAKHHEKFIKNLEIEFEKIYQPWSDQCEGNLRKIEEEREKTRKAEKEKQVAIDKEREVCKELDVKIKKMEEEMQSSIDVNNPIQSSHDRFNVKFVQADNNNNLRFFEIRLAMKSAKGLVRALDNLGYQQFHQYFVNLINRSNDLRRYEQSAKEIENKVIVDKIIECSSHFKAKVDEFEKKGSEFFYIKTYRSSKCNPNLVDNYFSDNDEMHHLYEDSKLCVIS